MIKRYSIENGEIKDTQKALPDIFVVINANEDEKRWFASNYQVDEHTFNSAFDPEEPARVEYEPEHIAVIFKRAKTHTPGDNFHFKISSCGLFLFRQCLIITLTEDVRIGDKREEVRHHGTTALNCIADRVLHERIGNKNPEGGKIRAESYQPNAKTMSLF